MADFVSNKEVTEIYAAAERLIKNNKPVLLLGVPGTGKTERLEQIGHRVKDTVTSFIASHHDVLSFVGVPRIEGDRTVFCPPLGVLPEADAVNGLVFVDEVSDASIEVQNALCSLLTTGRIGTWTMPAGSTVAMGGNRAKDRSGAHDIVTKLSNRLTVLELPDNAQAYVPDWMEWSRDKADIPLWVRAAVDQEATVLLDFNPNRRVNATPRSVTELARFAATELDLSRADSTDWDIFMTAGRGAVGLPATSKMAATAKHLIHAPSMREIVEAPDDARIPDDKAVLLSLAFMLGEGASWAGNAESNVDELCVYMQRIAMNNPEIATGFIYALSRRNDDRFSPQAFAESNKGRTLSSLGRVCGLANHKEKLAAWAQA